MNATDHLLNQAWLQVGLNRRDQLIHISESIRGKDCGLVCPHCYSPLIAKKGRVKIHHYAHVTDSCRPAVHHFDFWADVVENTNLPLDQLAHQHTMQIMGERQRLLDELAESQVAWQRTKALIEALCIVLSDVSKAYTNGSRPANRQINYDVLSDVEEFLESFSADRGPVPPLYKVRHSSFKTYWNTCLMPGRWGTVPQTGYLIYPRELWQQETGARKFIIPSELVEHYEALVNYHYHYNAMTDLTTEQEAFERTLLRFNTFDFYFIRIETTTGSLYKSGVTSRSLPERLAEIRYDLKSLGVITIVPIAVIRQAGYLEAYFKRKYAPFQYRINTSSTTLTEYFDLPSAELLAVVDALGKLEAVKKGKTGQLSRGECIREGMRHAKESGRLVGRPRVTESPSTFLQKPKSQTIIQLLQA